MAIPITIPRLGWNMEEGVFGGWLKKDGDTIRAGETVFTLETDKATEEIESLDSGTLHIVANVPKSGDTVAVGVVIGYLLQPGETAPALENRAAASAPVMQVVIERKGIAVSEQSRQRLAISPRARRAADRLGIDWTHLKGSGKTGRIRERDVLTANEPSRSAGSTLRKIIAQRMSASHLATAPVTLIATVDATSLVRLRNELKQSGDIAPGFTDIVIKFAAEALQQHPALNARWENERVVTLADINIGLAVDTPAGLLVPVVRDVSRRSLADIAAQTRALIERARERKLSAEEMRGGTFTISNLGSYGIDAFTPIINHPECAVLGLGRIQKQPVVIDDQIAIRDQITLSLTFDHRIVDGAPAARFLRTLRELIEMQR
jgi:pyruvate dehydrogenase E2 component (dihydrolipoyllysine-residue acetyltransferase)